MLFWGRLISGANTVPVVRSLFESRTESCFDTNIASNGVLPSIFASYFINATYLATLNFGFQHVSNIFDMENNCDEKNS